MNELKQNNVQLKIMQKSAELEDEKTEREKRCSDLAMTLDDWRNFVEI